MSICSTTAETLSATNAETLSATAAAEYTLLWLQVDFDRNYQRFQTQRRQTAAAVDSGKLRRWLSPQLLAAYRHQNRDRR